MIQITGNLRNIQGGAVVSLFGLLMLLLGSWEYVVLIPLGIIILNRGIFDIEDYRDKTFYLIDFSALGLYGLIIIYLSFFLPNFTSEYPAHYFLFIIAFLFLLAFEIKMYLDFLKSN